MCAPIIFADARRAPSRQSSSRPNLWPNTRSTLHPPACAFHPLLPRGPAPNGAGRSREKRYQVPISELLDGPQFRRELEIRKHPPFAIQSTLVYIHKCVLLGCAKSDPELSEARCPVRGGSDHLRRSGSARLGGYRALGNRTAIQAIGKITRRPGASGDLHDSEKKRWQRRDDSNYQRPASEPQRA